MSNKKKTAAGQVDANSEVDAVSTSVDSDTDRPDSFASSSAPEVSALDESAPSESAPAEVVPSEAATSEGVGTTSPRPAASPASRARRIGGGAASVPRQRAATAAAKDHESEEVAERKDNVATQKSTTSASRSARPTLTKAVSDTDASDLDPSDPAASTVDGAGSTKKRSLTVSLPPWAAWVPPVVFAAVAAVFLALIVANRVGANGSPVPSDKERQQVLAAAKTCLATLNTYDYKALDAAQKAGTACTTGRLTSDYKRTMTTIIKQNAPRLKAAQIAKINTAGIEAVSKSGKQFTVLLYAQLNVSSQNNPKGRVDPFAASVIMQKVGDKWLLAKVDTVSSLSG